MTHCNPCRMLSFTPQRRDVPSHLRRQRAADLRIGHLKLTAFGCVHCSTLWRWYAIDGWARADARKAKRVHRGSSFSECVA